MKTQGRSFRVSFLLAGILGVAYGLETYIGSGWAAFVRDTSIFGAGASHKVGGGARPTRKLSNVQKLVESFKEEFVISRSSSRLSDSSLSSSKNPKSLPRLIDHRLHCGSSERVPLNMIKANPSLSIWFAPYRLFPEASEGYDRGKGDYEFLSYVMSAKCSGVAINYGAFRGSPADRVFNDASDQGLRQEFLLAKNLGYDLFVLDLYKSWLSKGDANLCRDNSALCSLTSDGFLVINLKASDDLAKKPDFLRHSLRMGLHRQFLKALEANSISSVRPGYWSAWESLSPTSVLRWSIGGENNTTIDVLTPLAGNGIPANLSISLLANPALKAVQVEAVCTRGNQPTILITTRGSTDVTRQFSMCMPNYLKISPSAASAVPMPQQAPLLMGQDQMRSYFGIQYDLNTAL
jgi:hypothetical protein